MIQAGLVVVNKAKPISILTELAHWWYETEGMPFCFKDLWCTLALGLIHGTIGSKARNYGSIREASAILCIENLMVGFSVAR
jgi:hypothetical protein